MKISTTHYDDGIPVGNWENKYESKNFIAKYLVGQFLQTIKHLILNYGEEIDSINEIGCGEGYLSSFILSLNVAPVKGCDFSEKIVNFAKKRENNVHFYVRNIYNLKRENDKADLVICCEVLEHLEDPEKALETLSKITNKYLLLSVPNEPIWRILNVMRGAHLKRFGNTPGHLNHWTSKQFFELTSNYMQIIEIRKPLPWTILLLKKGYEK